jgi:hypothetical protein
MFDASQIENISAHNYHYIGTLQTVGEQRHLMAQRRKLHEYQQSLYTMQLRRPAITAWCSNGK